MAAKRNTPAPKKWRRHAIPIVALWVAALAAYSNSFRDGLVFDSQRVILADPRIQSDTTENVHLIWTGDYYNGTGSSALYRPFTTLTYLWNYNGANPTGYHAVNFALHAVNIALVYALGLLVLGEMAPAAAMAGLWAVHPVLTESVTNVVGRADLLAALGVLAGLLCYIRAAATDGWRRAVWMCALAVAAAIGIFSKETGAVLAAVMIAYDLAFSPKLTWRARIACYLAALLPAACYLAMRGRALAQVSSLLISFGDNPLQGAGFWTSRLTAIEVLGKYLWLLLWPARLSADYSYNQIPVSAADPKAVLALAVWIAVVAAAVFSFRLARPVFFFIALFAVTIAPVSNLVILVGSIMAERFLYLPSIGFAGCVAWALYRFAPARRVASGALSIACLALATRTFARNADWFDERSLWTSTVQVCPESYKAHQNLAMLLLAQPQPDLAGASREVERALAILDPLPDDRSMSSVYSTAGQIYRARGDLARALAVLERGRRIDRAWDAAFLARNRADGKTISDVGTPTLYLELGHAYRDLGRPEDALDAFRAGRVIDPQPAFFDELSRTYSGMRQPEQAELSLLEGLAIDPNQRAMVAELTQLYQETAPQTCALAHTAAGVTVDPNCPMVHAQLCTASQNVAALFTQMHDAASAAAVHQNAARNYGCR